MAQTYESSKPEADEENNQATEIWLTGQGNISKALSALLQHAWLVVKLCLTLITVISSNITTPLYYNLWKLKHCSNFRILLCLFSLHGSGNRCASDFKHRSFVDDVAIHCDCLH